jgi:hypothetical protein
MALLWLLADEKWGEVVGKTMISMRPWWKMMENGWENDGWCSKAWDFLAHFQTHFAMGWVVPWVVPRGRRDLRNAKHRPSFMDGLWRTYQGSPRFFARHLKRGSTVMDSVFWCFFCRNFQPGFGHWYIMWKINGAPQELQHIFYQIQSRRGGCRIVWCQWSVLHSAEWRQGLRWSAMMSYESHRSESSGAPDETWRTCHKTCHKTCQLYQIAVVQVGQTGCWTLGKDIPPRNPRNPSAGMRKLAPSFLELRMLRFQDFEWYGSSFGFDRHNSRGALQHPLVGVSPAHLFFIKGWFKVCPLVN